MAENLNETEADLEMILAGMALDFVIGCEDQLDEIDACLERLRNHQGVAANDILEVKRHIHSLKGLGGTFRYPSISLIAHTLEDYFETLYEVSDDGIFDIQMYVDRLREIAESRVDMPHDETLEMLEKLPLKARRRAVTKNNRELTLLLHMPVGIQRKIIGKELAQFGFNVIISETVIDAISDGLSRRPDIIMSTMVSDGMSGLELAGVFYAVNATKNSPFLLVTTGSRDQNAFSNLPENVTLLRKGREFARDLMGFMKEHGYVGVSR